MMPLTLKRNTTALKNGLTAAFMALPGDKLMTMFLTVGLTTAYLLIYTLLTDEVFLPSVDHFFT